MRVGWSADGRAAIIDPEGELDLPAMLDVKKAIAALLRDGCRVLIVNCHGVERLHCRSLAVLVERLCQARELGAALALVDLHPALATRIRELRLDSLLPSFGTVGEALSYLTTGV
jgi:anti-anti-sigma factor